MTPIIPGCVAQAGVLALMTTIAGLVVVAERQGAPPVCLMRPPATRLQLPASGFVEAFDKGQPACRKVLSSWTRGALRSSELAVSTDGPEGSGRFWAITVGLTPTAGADPNRGVCFETSTRGFMTLGRFGGGALPWVADRDADGHAEFVLWNTFSTTAAETPPESGLMAWVYRVDPAAGLLTIDWPLSRAIATELSAAFREPVAAPATSTVPLSNATRRAAADALAAFATRRCTVPDETKGR